jgi:hypothetical protein
MNLTVFMKIVMARVVIPLHSYYIDCGQAHAGHSCSQTRGIGPPSPPDWEGCYPKQAPPSAVGMWDVWRQPI